MRIEGNWRLLLVGAPMLMVAQVLGAQEAAPAVPAPQTAQGAGPQVAAPVKASADAEKAKAEAEKKQERAKAEEEKKTERAKAEEEKKARKAEEARKKIYTGPNSVIVMPATPMLDEEGRQRLDPDNQPMFNPPVRQQRDKKGHPLFDNGKPVFQTATDLGYDEHGKKIRVHKEKPPKMIPVSIARGTFTVDGMIGKAELNYNIPDFKYIYLYAPGIGTLVVSNRPFPGAKEEKNAFNGKTLTVTTEDHKLQVASDTLIRGKKAESAFVLVDRDFHLPTPYPVVGYGGSLKAPYVWPGSRENAPLKGAFVQPPPIPVDLRPVLLLPACPAGEMRKTAPLELPGQKAEAQPCIPIPKGTATMSGPGGKKAAAAPATAPAPPAATTAPATTPAPQSMK